MSTTINDLRPKNFTITVKGVELKCKPVLLKHALVMAKVGNVFENPAKADTSSIEQAQKDMSGVINSLIPDIDFEPDMNVMIDILGKLMNQITPDDNKELEEKGVKIGNTDPKA